MNTAQKDNGLFDGGPLLAWQKSIHLIRSSSDRGTLRRSVAAILLGWIPVAILALIDVGRGNTTASSFFADVAMHARFLIAVPMLLLAEADSIPWFDRISRHFSSSGLVPSHERDRYEKAIRSTRRLLDAKAAEYIIVALAYVTVAVLITNLQHSQSPAWYWSGEGQLDASAAGLWHALISLPLLLILLFGWLWRLLLWWRFLALMAKLDLQLIPGHPDRAAGLKFLSAAIRGYRLLAGALGVIVAGSQIDQILRTGQPTLDIKYGAGAVAGLVIIFAAGPLAMFIANLRDAKLRGMFKYGPLVRGVGAEFERKWLDQLENLNAGTLEAPDFSAMTDLNQVVAGVYEVSDFPFRWQDLSHVVVAALIPFIPVALMAVPVGEIWEVLKTLLL